MGRRHFLHTPAADVATVAAGLVGLHSSDPATVYLSVRARTADFDEAMLGDALYNERSVVRMLGMRRTMFVVPRHLAAVMDSACTQALLGAERRRLVGWLADQPPADDVDRWLGDVERRTLLALDELGEATAAELKAHVPELAMKLTVRAASGTQATVGLSTRVLFLLATSGRIVRARPRGSWLSTQYRWATTEHWLGEPLQEIDERDASAELVRRWLGAFGPGTFTDLKWWTGWTVGKTRGVLGDVGAVEVGLDEGTGYVLPDDRDEPRPLESWVALLPGLDPTVMGWKQRQWYLGDHAAALFDRNGNAGPTVWLDGRVVGGWAQRSGGDVVVRLLEDVGSDVTRAIDAEAERLADWLGDVRIIPRFRTPLEKDLVG
jgi:hypothetical protein